MLPEANFASSPKLSQGEVDLEKAWGGSYHSKGCWILDGNMLVSFALILKQKKWSGGIDLNKVWLKFGMLGRLSSGDLKVFVAYR